MLTLDTFRINGFRGIQSLELKGLGDINLIVGSNGSGKTTILEALQVYCRPFDTLTWINVARWRESRPSTRVKLASFRWVFPCYSDDEFGSVDLRGEGVSPIRRVTGELEDYYGYPDSSMGAEGSGSEYGAEEEESSGSSDAVGASLFVKVDSTAESVEQHFELWDRQRLVRESVSPPTVKMAAISSHSHFTESATRLSKLIKRRLKGDVLGLMQMFDSRIVDVLVLDEGGLSTVNVEHSELGLIPLSALGEGLRRALAYALVIEDARDGILLIDQIETALDRDNLGVAIDWLLRISSRVNAQLFVTTHSLEAIDAILSHVGSARAVGFRLKAKDGKPAVTRFDGDLLHDIRYDQGLDVR